MRGFIWGHAWFYSGGRALFYSGGMVLFGGRAWFYSGGMRGFSSFFGYNEIRSMSGRYASYWNVFLFTCTFTCLLPTATDISANKR